MSFYTNTVANFEEITVVRSSSLTHSLLAETFCPIGRCPKKFDRFTDSMIMSHLERHAHSGDMNEKDKERLKIKITRFENDVFINY